MRMRRSSSPHTSTHKVENSRESQWVRHSFSVCVCACLRWINSFSHVLSIPALLSLSLDLLSSHMLRVLVLAGCVFKATLTRQTCSAFLSEVLLLCLSSWVDPHTHSTTCPSTHLNQAQTQCWSSQKAAAINILIITMDHITTYMWKKLISDEPTDNYHFYRAFEHLSAHRLDVWFTLTPCINIAGSCF